MELKSQTFYARCLCSLNDTKTPCLAEKHYLGQNWTGHTDCIWGKTQTGPWPVACAVAKGSKWALSGVGDPGSATYQLAIAELPGHLPTC